MADRTEGLGQRHDWNMKPVDLSPKKQTVLGLIVAGRIVPPVKPNVTSGNYDWSRASKKLAKEGEEITELAWEYMPDLEPMFRK